MKLLQILLLILISLILINPGYSQRKKNLRKADDTYSAGQYFKAIELYEKKYAKIRNSEQKAEVAFKVAESYRELNLPKKAENWYKKAVKLKYPDPLTTLYFADVLKMNGKFDEAMDEYKEYSKLMPDDVRGTEGIQSCRLAIEWTKNPTRHVITQIKEINSKQYDFSPTIADDESDLYFTSNREGSKGTAINNVVGQSYADIFVTRKDRKGDWSTPTPVKGAVNTEYEEGTPCFAEKGKVMYYTSCPTVKKQNLGCKIMTSTLNGEEWGQPGEVKIVEDSSITVAHPAISANELTLYFVSDMKGGIGGKDIWISTRPNKTAPWNKPKNAGPEINSINDEMYTYLRDDSTLYFSSTGHIGLGGLDIFKAKKDSTGRWKIENLKIPINSTADDFGIVYIGKEERGYFSSTREGSVGNDDIWYFELPELKFSLDGIVQEEESRMPLGEVKVQLLGSDGTSYEANTKNDGKFTFKLNPNTDYRAITEKDGYLKGKAKETTKGLKENQVLKMVIAMPSTAVPIPVDNIFYDLDKADLRDESKVELNKLVETLIINPITIELASHTDFRGTDEHNYDLSQRRAQSVVDYLIQKGITPERVKAKGYGKDRPKKVTRSLAEKNSFLKEGDILDEKFINALPNDEQKEICNQINRRTEFSVLSVDKKKTYFFGDEPQGIEVGNDQNKEIKKEEPKKEIEKKDKQKK